MPDTKTQKTPWDKNWERIPQPNAAAQTLGVRGVNYWVKLWSVHFQRFSIELNTVQPLILAKKPLQLPHNNNCSNTYMLSLTVTSKSKQTLQRHILLTSILTMLLSRSNTDKISSISNHSII